MSVFRWPTNGGVEFRETGNWVSPHPRWGWQRSQIVSEYLVQWKDHLIAIPNLLGRTNISQGNVGGVQTPYLRRDTPHPHPSSPRMHATAVSSVTPAGTPLGFDTNGVANYTDARLEVIYETLLWDIEEDSQIRNPAWGNLPDEALLLRYIYRREEDREKSRTFKSGSWIFEDNGLTASDIVQVTFPITRITWTWMQVPYAFLPRSKHLKAVGKVNKFAFDGCAAETLLIRAPRYEVYMSHYGIRTADVSIIADMNPLGWNAYPDPLRNNTYHRIVSIGRTFTPYPILEDSFFPTIRIEDMFRPSQTG